MRTRESFGKLVRGIGFIGPNALGFLTFALVPLAVSFLMAFTNWDVRLHNRFTGDAVRFVGLANFRRLFAEPDFLQYLGNTLFFMIGIPISMAGSLGAALLLCRDINPGRRTPWSWLLCTAVLTGSLLLLLAFGCGATATVLFLVGLFSTILLGGGVGGTTVYRTIFFSPHFTAGVATFLLWKKMYSPHTGPINAVLAPVLDRVQGAVNAIPAAWVRAGAWLCVGVVVLLLARRTLKLTRAWRDGEAGTVAVVLSVALLAVPVALAPVWAPTPSTGLAIVAGALLPGAFLLRGMLRGCLYPCPLDYGIAITAVPSGVTMVFALAFVGLAGLLHDLPVLCTRGLAPPEWLSAYHWAKPALMIMGLWASIGSNNMLLYLAGLSNIPRELYEAADVDGASRGQRFWHITWPQLAPVTFFIFIMSVIGGLQGGFEMARTMTGGGPAGATTTLSYFIYQEGFVTGRLGYASAASWALFLLVFLVTLANWKFGNRYVGD